MADLMTGSSGYATGAIDTATTQINDDPRPLVGEASADKINGVASAVVQVENVLGVGTDLKGTAADLVARLAVEHNPDGTQKTLIVGRGGTGAATHPLGSVLGGNGTSPLVNTGVGTQGQVVVSQGASTPLWAYGLLYHGPSSCGAGSSRTHEGATVISSNTSLGGVHFYTSFTLNSGVTLTVPANSGRLVIIATNTITINGTIAANGAGKTTGDPSHGTDQPAGAGGAGSAENGQSGGSVYVHNVLLSAGGTGGSGAGGAHGGQVSGSAIATLLNPFTAFGGAEGGYGGDDSGAGARTTGGAGGASVVLVAPTIVLASTATINTSGANGATGDPGNSNGGAGGGGAGNLYILCRSFTDNGATITQNGGNGGSSPGGASAGSAGAAGIKQILIYG